MVQLGLIKKVALLQERNTFFVKDRYTGVYSFNSGGHATSVGVTP